MRTETGIYPRARTALAAAEEALIHLELAQMDRERRDDLATAGRATLAAGRPANFGTEKES